MFILTIKKIKKTVLLDEKNLSICPNCHINIESNFCPNCGAMHIYHTVCGECGYYRGKLAIEKVANA